RRLDRGALAPVAGLLLDSPWFQLDVPDRARPLLDGVIRALGAARPFYRLPLPTSDRYVKSTHVDHDGDFDFDLTLKPMGGVGVRPGWLAAIRRGHRALQSGLDLPLPVLMLRSTASTVGRRDRTVPVDVDTDLILDVRSMQRFVDRVSEDVTDIGIPGARHDVFLSRPDVLDVVFGHLGRAARCRALAPACPRPSPTRGSPAPDATSSCRARTPSRWCPAISGTGWTASCPSTAPTPRSPDPWPRAPPATSTSS